MPNDRACTVCGRSVEDAPYRFWMFQTCQSCAAERAPTRWTDTGTARKFRYFPHWHFTEHPGREPHWRTKEIVTDGGRDLGEHHI